MQLKWKNGHMVSRGGRIFTVLRENSFPANIFRTRGGAGGVGERKLLTYIYP